MSHANTYRVGQLVTVLGVFTQRTDPHDPASGVPVDPATVAIEVTDPSSVETTWVFGTDPEVENDDVGKYHANVDVDAAGTWRYRWVSTGNGQAAGRGRFIVKSETSD